MTALLRVQDLHVSYGGIPALKGVSLEVSQGEIVTLIGANGAGKTTLLKSISAVIPKRSGDVFLLEQNITLSNPQDIVRMGMSHVPEGRGIFKELTVKENLALGAYFRKDSRQIKQDLERMLSMFPRLQERLAQQAGTLSGGEQQMLAIARSLMARPQLLLLDEPSLGLAPLLVLKIFEIIAEIHQQGCSILIVEQNANLALQHSDRAYVLETGRVILQGKSEDLMSNPDVKKAYLGG